MREFMRCGEWERGRQYGNRLSDILDQSNPSRQLVRYLGSMALMEYEIGENKVADDYLIRYVEAVQTVPTEKCGFALIPLIAIVTNAMDYLDTAELSAQRWLDQVEKFPEFQRRGWLGLGLIAVLKGDQEAAAERYAQLVSWREKMPTPFNRLTLKHALGLMAVLIGEIDAAMEHFREGYEFCMQRGVLPEHAWTCYDWACALIRRGSGQDRSEAKKLLDEGLSIAEKLGMKPLKERIIESFETLRAKPVYPDGLTPREVGILRLISTGKTNQEIANLLFISDKTVARHISNILSKTKTGNRTEAAQYALHHGLTGD
jgi:DNA-binding CsgD family transcriptional regulator